VDQLGYEDVAAERFGADKLPGICDGQSEEHKALAVKIIEDVYAVRDALIVCWYSVSWPPVFWIDDFAKVLKLVTGYEGFADPRKLMIMGERMVNLKRAFNVREGIRRKDDTLPERFTKEPMPAGPAKGQVVDLERMLNEYYQLRNWDLETGIPKRETFDRLGMMDIAEELERSGVKLP
jgi:aldehyde:ferredoxin oxidoreductase